MVTWYEWDSWQDFNVWHDAKVEELNLPQPAFNQATGDLDPKAQKVLRYTDGREINGKIIAIVEEAHAQGLRVTELRPPTPEIFIANDDA